MYTTIQAERLNGTTAQGNRRQRPKFARDLLGRSHVPSPDVGPSGLQSSVVESGTLDDHVDRVVVESDRMHAPPLVQLHDE